MEWQEINETVNGEQKTENLRIRMKIIDMIEYAMPLIERWSVPHQKLLGDRIAACMEDMLEIANELELAYSKKTPHKNLDMKNKALQDYVTLAYRLKYLKGATSHAEWTRRSKEIGCMLGGYKKWLYDDTPSTAKSSGKQQTSSSKKSYQCRSR